MSDVPLVKDQTINKRGFLSITPASNHVKYACVLCLTYQRWRWLFDDNQENQREDTDKNGAEEGCNC